jgi:hypothetical protein
LNREQKTEIQHVAYEFRNMVYSAELESKIEPDSKGCFFRPPFSSSVIGPAYDGSAGQAA